MPSNDTSVCRRLARVKRAGAPLTTTKAMGELHRQEDVGGSVARRLYADPVPLDGHHDIARFRDGRRHIIRNHRDLIEMAPVFPDPIDGLIRGGRLHEPGRTVGSQIDIAEFKQVDARGAWCGDGSAKCAGVSSVSASVRT